MIRKTYLVSLEEDQSEVKKHVLYDNIVAEDISSDDTVDLMCVYIENIVSYHYFLLLLLWIVIRKNIFNVFKLVLGMWIMW